MELSIESSCQCAMWKVRDFFELPSEVGYSLDSPEFLFAGDRYCLRLYPNGSQRYEDGTRTKIKLMRLTSTFPKRSVSYKTGYKWRYDKGSEVDVYCNVSSNELLFSQSTFQNDRDFFVPDGTFTVLCSMRLKEQSSAGNQQPEDAKTSDTKEELEELSGQSVCFSSRWWPFEMELSVESPCQHVTWKVPDLFLLLSKLGYSLNSPEFRFAGDKYCLRFYPKGNNDGNTVDTDLQLVRLTSTFPKRIVLYKVGFRCRNPHGLEADIYTYSDTLIDEFGLCLSLSQLEKNKSEYVPDGTLTVLCSMHLKKQSSTRSPQSEEAGNSHSEEKQEGLPKTPNSVSCAVQTEVSDTVVDKEKFKNEDVSSLDTKDLTHLSERMKNLLNKGNDYDLTICVKDKEFRAHRNILSASSPVFAMMLSHDTKERNTGTISIEDCDPDSFDEFLLYVYSGRTENLTSSNALHIYYIADKYDFPALKERCVKLLKTSLSVTSICDVVLLAAKHGEKELLEVASEFFAQNIQEILVSIGWQRFLSQNPVEANELYIKSIKFYLPRN